MKIKFSTLLSFPPICKTLWERDHVWGHPCTLCCLPGVNLEPGNVCTCSSAVRHELTSFRCWSWDCFLMLSSLECTLSGSQFPMAHRAGLFHVWPQAHWENGGLWPWGSDAVFVYFENSPYVWSGTISCLQEKGGDNVPGTLALGLSFGTGSLSPRPSLSFPTCDLSSRRNRVVKNSKPNGWESGFQGYE